MKYIITLIVCVFSCCCQNRGNNINSNKDNTIVTKSIFTVPSIQDSLDSFIGSISQYNVFTISCYETDDFKKLTFWASEEDIIMRIKDPLAEQLQLAEGVAREYGEDKIVAIDSVSLCLLKNIIDTTDFNNELYVFFTNNDDDDNLVVKVCRKNYKIIDMKQLVPIL